MPTVLRLALHLLASIPLFVFGASLHAAQSDQGPYLEEVVVTATKRDENIEDVPISISVVSGETIDKFQIVSLQDLQSFVPNLTVQKTFGNWAVRIRGLGSGVTNLAFDSSVSIFNDGIYCGRSRCLETAYLDPGRVEVARGPQGALFGKSTIAGAISTVAARPTDTFESYARAGYEFEYGGYTVAGMVSGPISDTVRARLAGEYKDLDGWMHNPYGTNDEPRTEAWALRGSMEWDVNENSELYLKLEGFSNDISGRSNQLVTPGTFGGLTADPNPEYKRDDVRRVSTGTGKEDFDNSDSFSVTAQYDVNFLEGHTLSIIGGYWELDYKNYLDVDGVPENFLNTTLSEDYDQESLEVRLLSPTGNTFEYIAGVLYHTSSTETSQDSPFGFFPPVVAPVPVGSVRTFARDTDTWSVYGQLTWNITSRLRAIVDARYTDEKQKAKAHAYPATYPDLITPVYTPTAFNQPPEYRFQETYNDDNFDPSIRVQYDWTDSLMVYAAISTGSKPGGLKANDGNLGTQMLEKADADYYQRYVGQSTVTPADLINGLMLQQGNGVFDFEGEDATNYEIGAKALFAGGRMYVNAAVFYMTFDNLQTSSYDGTRFIIQNAASAEVSGFELESSWAATGDLQLSGSLGYTDATYDKFLGAQCIVKDADGTLEDPTCVDGSEDLSGKRLERSPKWEANLSLDWQKQFANNLMLLTNLAFYYSSDYYVRQDFHPLGRQSAFTKWNARVALTSAADTWELAFIGRNLTDERIIQHAYEIAGSNFVAEGPGRTLTLEATYRFH